MDAERLWRVRKRHAAIDAIAVPHESGAVDLQYVYDGRVLQTRRWPSKEAAIDAARRTLADLQRAGWATHW